MGYEYTKAQLIALARERGERVSGDDWRTAFGRDDD